jgi:RNA polymerase sigma-70 factor (ECF subfamily)
VVDTELQLTDEEIAVRIQKGDADVFGVLVDRYEQKLLRYGTKFLARTEDIEDMVQDIFVSAYRNIQSFDSSLRFSPWIYRIAHNAFVNGLRQNKRGPVYMDFDTLLAHQVYEDQAETERDQKDMRALIDRGLQGMSAKYQEILVLHYFEEMAYKDIADILQIPIGTVSVRMRRAKEALKASIKDQI